MKLTKTQIAWLKNSLGSRDRQPTFWLAFWSVRKAWLPALLVAVVGVWQFAADAPVLGCILIAIAWGNIFASVSLSARAVSLWPAFHEVTDWQRVETLIRENDDHAS
jgi:hypothetical protein